VARRIGLWGTLAGALSRQLPSQRETLHLSFSLASVERLEEVLLGTLGAGFVDVKLNASSAWTHWSHL